MPTAVHDLRWADVDPRTHDFDSATARTLAEAVLLDETLTDSADRDDVEATLDRAPIAAFGAWAAGWCGALSEPGWGGPMRAWCCGEHSIRVGNDFKRRRTIERVCASIFEYRTLLCELTERFDALAADTAHLGFEKAVEHAASQLPLVVERTQAEDASYNTFAKLLTWYLESRGHDPECAGTAVDRVTNGRFDSWAAPTPEVAPAACAEIGRRVTKALADDTHCDEARASGSPHATRPSSTSSTSPRTALAHIDGHRRYMDGSEHARDPERGRRMSAALDACRAAYLVSYLSGAETSSYDRWPHRPLSLRLR